MLFKAFNHIHRISVCLPLMCQTPDLECTLPPVGRSMFCSEGIFGAVLFHAREISLLKRSLVLGGDSNWTWLVGPQSWPRYLWANGDFAPWGPLRTWGAAGPSGVLQTRKDSVGKNGPRIGGSVSTCQCILRVYECRPECLCLRQHRPHLAVTERWGRFWGWRMSPCHVPAPSACTHSL